MSIIRFTIPMTVEPLVENFDNLKIVNAVQSELNKGKVLKTSCQSKQDWKTVKDDDGNERMVLLVGTKAGERLQLETTIGARFYGWCMTVAKLNTFATTESKLPECFEKWLTGFATKP